MLTVEVERLVHVRDPLARAAKGPDEEGVVGPAGARNLLKTDAAPPKEAAAINACPDGGVVEQQLDAVSDRERLRRRLHAMEIRAGRARLGPVLAEKAPVRAAHDIDLAARLARDRLGAGDHLLERGEVQIVVGFHDGDPLALGRGDPAVHGRPVSLVGLVHHDYARVACGVGARDRGRFIG